MNVNEHALERALSRFGIHGIDFIKSIIRKSTNRFDVMDTKLSYDTSKESVRRTIVVDEKRKAYFVVEQHTVLTVLTEEMAFRALKNGKWVVVS